MLPMTGRDRMWWQVRRGVWSGVLAAAVVLGSEASAQDALPVITEVRVEQEGRLITDPSVLSLIETTRWTLRPAARA